jgi:hypothetical protein
MRTRRMARVERPSLGLRFSVIVANRSPPARCEPGADYRQSGAQNEFIYSGRPTQPPVTTRLMTQTGAKVNWFERVWEHREEVLYPSLFGSSRRGIFPIQTVMLTEMLKQESFDPRWLHYGVFEFAPTSSRDSWLYVTSGMSNDWEAASPDPSNTSGLGCEFVLETTQQAEWAILCLLHVMTFQILLYHGRYPGSQPLRDFDRIPLRGSIRAGQSLLTRLMVAPPARFPRDAQLDSGSFSFHQLVGISEAETEFARAHDGPALLELLLAHGYFPVTDPDRKEVTYDAA